MSESIRGRIADIERRMMVDTDLPESVDEAWFESFGDGLITDPPDELNLTPKQREAFYEMAAMINSVPPCDE